MRLSRVSLPALALALAACGGDATTSQAGPATAGDPSSTSLPAPAGTPGSGVTGMPDEPGPNESGPPDEAIAQAAPALGPDGLPLPAAAETAAVDPATGVALAPTAPASPMDPSDAGAAPAPRVSDTPAVDAMAAEEAVATVREYHASISAGALGRAYALWADGGRASGQTPQEFADGFALVDSLSVSIAPPTRADAALARVPVTLTLRRRDGSERRLAGHYTLRRDALDPAAGWRIAGARLREPAP